MVWAWPADRAKGLLSNAAKPFETARTMYSPAGTLRKLKCPRSEECADCAGKRVRPLGLEGDVRVDHHGAAWVEDCAADASGAPNYLPWQCEGGEEAEQEKEYIAQPHSCVFSLTLCVTELWMKLAAEGPVLK